MRPEGVPATEVFRRELTLLALIGVDRLDAHSWARLVRCAVEADRVEQLLDSTVGALNLGGLVLLHNALVLSGDAAARRWAGTLGCTKDLGPQILRERVCLCPRVVAGSAPDAGLKRCRW
jgi:hypothetical protein